MGNRKTEKTRTAQYWFDQELADRIEQFFALLITHTGDFLGQPFELEQWQLNWMHTLLCWKNAKTGRRRYRKAHLEVPRKNGKTTTIAGASWWFLRMDGADRRLSKKIYTCAADKDQAKELHDAAKIMGENVPELSAGCEVYRDSIYDPSTHSAHIVLSAEAFTKHGKNPSIVLFDELHAQPNRELYDVMATGMGARKEPLMITITTAGHDRHSIGYEVHDYAKKVRDGVIEDDGFFPTIYAADPEDDWTQEATWKKANPNYGVSVDPEFLRTECYEARHIPARQNRFLRLYLNIWTEQAERWLPLEEWDECAGKIPWARMDGRECYAGLDLGATRDLAALALVFPPLEKEKVKLWRLGLWTFIPEDSIDVRSKRDKVPYDQWADQGLMIRTPGSATDYEFIQQFIMYDIASRFRVLELAADPWNARQMMQNLDREGMVTFDHRQGFNSMAEPCKDFERSILARSIRHDGNPLMRWAISNAAASEDPAGNVKPDKKRSRDRIDPLVATIMALGRAMLRARAEEGSVYDTRGVVTIGGDDDDQGKEAGGDDPGTDERS